MRQITPNNTTNQVLRKIQEFVTLYLPPIRRMADFRLLQLRILQTRIPQLSVSSTETTHIGSDFGYFLICFLPRITLIFHLTFENL